jgi:hypothetical protein
MPRLFVGPREHAFIADITKEVIKDINGQKIYYYPISELKTQVHTVYQESPEKVFDNPVIVDCMASAFTSATKTGRFGPDREVAVEVFLQTQDLIDKGIEIIVGDFFSYGENFYEVTNIERVGDIYGQTEHENGIKLIGTHARRDLFVAKLVGPTSAKYSDADAVQNNFYQQRGNASNTEGVTGDKRALRESGVLESTLSGPKEVSTRGDSTGAGSSFYDEE